MSDWKKLGDSKDFKNIQDSLKNITNMLQHWIILEQKKLTRATDMIQHQAKVMSSQEKNNGTN